MASLVENPGWMVLFRAALAVAGALLLISFALRPAGIPWPAFAANSVKHAATPLTNHMGLKTVIAFEPASRAAVSAPLGLEVDPFAVWKDARGSGGFSWRSSSWGSRSPCEDSPPGWPRHWARVSSPSAPSFTCYYYTVLLAYGLLWREEDFTGIGLVMLPFRVRHIY